MSDIGRIEQFKQIIAGPVWDGDLISKTDRTELVKQGWVGQDSGFNVLTLSGVRTAVALGLLRERRPLQTP